MYDATTNDGFRMNIWYFLKRAKRPLIQGWQADDNEMNMK